MSSPESKRALLEGQVNSKIYWGATRTEVTDWLEMEKGVSSADAEELVRNALHIRSATTRRRAVMTLVCSTVGVLIAAGFAALSGPGFMRRAWYLAVAIGTPSVVLLLKSIVHLARGESDDPLE